MTARVLPSGDRAILVECGSLDEVLALGDRLRDSWRDGIVDVVPAARTVLVSVDPARLPLDTARSWLAGLAMDGAGGTAGARAPVPVAPAVARATPAPTVTIEVRYDGEDLDEVAGLLGSSPAEVVALHTGSVWRVAFCGFAPGFAYLVTDHDNLVVPRRGVPRTRVPAGAVGLAGVFSGVYPRESPGGWQLIGRTDAVLWDAASDRPALLAPGTVVRFRSIG
ncbi:5-oxoprolinase subunit B family protein [Luethyella okanaganae]|uniref:Allophanate hydrolase subunit 1 n=1 Tax=Luethyella okanaganae TaxID=69372 RepID=A0ABW1VFE5_9MICO